VKNLTGIMSAVSAVLIAAAIMGTFSLANRVSVVETKQGLYAEDIRDIKDNINNMTGLLQRCHKEE